jgi:hypothetical protein
LRLLSHLFAARAPLVARHVSEALGFTEREAAASLEKLADARLASRRSGGWSVLGGALGLTELAAVEAKMACSARAAEQALINTRFASLSYALVGSANPRRGAVETFKRLGIGLIAKGAEFREIVEARRQSLPAGHVSLQFNEWIGKALVRQGGAPCA